MNYTQTCPRCGLIFAGEDPDSVATEAVEHARVAHEHIVTHEHMLSHLDVEQP